MKSGVYKEMTVGKYTLRFFLTKDGRWTCGLYDLEMEPVLNQDGQTARLNITDFDVEPIVKNKEAEV